MKKKKKIMMYYIVFIILKEATPVYGLGLSVPLVGLIAWAHQPFEVS